MMFQIYRRASKKQIISLITSNYHRYEKINYQNDTLAKLSCG